MLFLPLLVSPFLFIKKIKAPQQTSDTAITLPMKASLIQTITLMRMVDVMAVVVINRQHNFTHIQAIKPFP